MIALITISIMLGIVYIGQFCYTLIEFSFYTYKTKREFLLNLIPFYFMKNIIKEFIEHFKELK